MPTLKQIDCKLDYKLVHNLKQWFIKHPMHICTVCRRMPGESRSVKVGFAQTFEQHQTQPICFLCWQTVSMRLQTAGANIHRLNEYDIIDWWKQARYKNTR